MPKASSIIEGLQIILKYVSEDTWMNAEHDIIYAPAIPENKKITDEDKKRLKNLGWHFEEDTESWAAFV